jgi:hypothetical protein
MMTGMAPPRPLRVFLSYTPELAEFPADGSFAAIAAAAVRDAGGVPVHPEPDELRRRDVFGVVDLVVSIVGFRSGLEPGENARRTLVESDLGFAGLAGVPHVAVVLSEDVVGPARMFLDLEHGDVQAGFRARIEGSAVSVSTGDELRRAVTEGVAAFTRSRPADRGPRLLRRLPPPPPYRVVGRDDLLDRLWDDRRSRVRILGGWDGLGKTTIATAYAHRHMHQYDLVWWIPCSLPDAVPLALAELARVLGSRHLDVREALEDLREFLQRPSGRWLVVLDDVVELEPVRVVLEGECEVLVTTSRPGLYLGGEEYHVRALDPADAELLLEESTVLPPRHVSRLAEDLGHVPAALAAAVTYFRFTGATYEQYREDLASVRREVAREVLHHDHDLGTRAALRLVMDAVRDMEPDVLGAVTMAAWLGTERVPLDLVAERYEISPIGSVPAAWRPQDHALFASIFRLITTLDVDAGTVTVPPVLAAELRADSQRISRPETWVTALARMLAMELGKPAAAGGGNRWDHLISHVLAVRERVRPFSGASAAVTGLLEDAVGYLGGIGAVKVAHRISGEVAAMRESKRVEDSRRTFDALVAEHARRSDRSAEGDEDTVGKALLRAEILRRSGKPHEARAAYEELVHSIAETHGESDERLFRAQSELGALLRELGMDAEARVLLEGLAARALVVLDADHPITLTAWSDLADVLHDQGDTDRALTLDRRVFETTQRVFGGSHPRTLAAKTGLAADYLESGELERARGLAEDAYARYQRVLGPEHPDTLAAAGTLAAVLSASGEVVAAKELDQETYERCLRTLGPDDPATLLAANNLAADLRVLGEVAAAFALDRDTVERLRLVLGPDHPDTVRAAENLALDEQLLAEPRGAAQRKIRSRRTSARRPKDVG